MRQGIEQILSPKQQRRLLPFILYLSFFYSMHSDMPTMGERERVCVCVWGCVCVCVGVLVGVCVCVCVQGV